MEDQETILDHKSSVLEELVCHRWVYENGTLINILEAHRGILSGEVLVKGSEKTLHFRGYYESDRLGHRLTITGLPSYILDTDIGLPSFSAQKLDFDLDGSLIELVGSLHPDFPATLHTTITYLQVSRRARSRSHTPTHNTRSSDFSPSFSESSISSHSIKHRPRCVSKDMIIQQAPTKSVTWQRISEDNSASSDSTDSTNTDA